MRARVDNEEMSCETGKGHAYRTENRSPPQPLSSPCGLNIQHHHATTPSTRAAAKQQAATQRYKEASHGPTETVPDHLHILRSLSHPLSLSLARSGSHVPPNRLHKRLQVVPVNLNHRLVKPKVLYRYLFVIGYPLKHIPEFVGNDFADDW